METNELKTRDQVIHELAFKGISLRKWSLDNGVDYKAAHGVLYGKRTGRIGKCHIAAVKLGLKNGAIVGE